jgi:PBP1b-binding outer membrane lipoprotein LpoB
MNKLMRTIFLLIMLVAGCSNYANMKQMNMFDEVTTSFKYSMNWSDFEAANQLRKEARTESNPPDFKKLKNVRVTSYEVKRIIPMDNKLKVRQIVEINYYKSDNMIEKTLTHDQLWEYDTADKIWYLKGRFPDFK